MSGLEVVFGAFAVLAVASGLLAVTSPQVVHCALWLVVCLGSLAGVYLVLGAEVVALVQLLVYVGAVVVLVLFALMLTRAPIAASRDLDAGPGQRIAAAVAGLAVAGVVGGTLMVVAGDTVIGVDAGRGSPAAVGRRHLRRLAAAVRAAERPAPGRPGRRARDLQDGRRAERTATRSAPRDPSVEGPALHLVGPMVLAAALAGIGVYGLLARRNAVLVLIGAELLLNAAGVLLVAGSALPSGGLAAMRTTSSPRRSRSPTRCSPASR